MLACMCRDASTGRGRNGDGNAAALRRSRGQCSRYSWARGALRPTPCQAGGLSRRQYCPITAQAAFHNGAGAATKRLGPSLPCALICKRTGPPSAADKSLAYRCEDTRATAAPATRGRKTFRRRAHTLDTWKGDRATGRSKRSEQCSDAPNECRAVYTPSRPRALRLPLLPLPPLPPERPTPALAARRRLCILGLA